MMLSRSWVVQAMAFQRMCCAYNTLVVHIVLPITITWHKINKSVLEVLFFIQQKKCSGLMCICQTNAQTNGENAAENFRIQYNIATVKEGIQSASEIKIIGLYQDDIYSSWGKTIKDRSTSTYKTSVLRTYLLTFKWKKFWVGRAHVPIVSPTCVTHAGYILLLNDTHTKCDNEAKNFRIHYNMTIVEGFQL